MEQTAVGDRKKGKCSKCNKNLLLGYKDLCVFCENIFLHEELIKKDLVIAQIKKTHENKDLVIAQIKKSLETIK